MYTSKWAITGRFKVNRGVQSGAEWGESVLDASEEPVFGTGFGRNFVASLRRGDRIGGLGKSVCEFF
jgi:hypothetical protein